jgi:hypothetical protein
MLKTKHTKARKATLKKWTERRSLIVESASPSLIQIVANITPIPVWGTITLMANGS